jgi:hypothetical protein
VGNFLTDPIGTTVDFIKAIPSIPGTLINGIYCVGKHVLTGDWESLAYDLGGGAVLFVEVYVGAKVGGGVKGLADDALGATDDMIGAADDFAGAADDAFCFVAGTAVITLTGSKAIEAIQAGDIVLSENELTGETGYKRVVQTFVSETDELVHVHVNGETISATPEHPFYVPQKGWVDSIQLRTGDILVLQNGR